MLTERPSCRYCKVGKSSAVVITSASLSKTQSKLLLFLPGKSLVSGLGLTKRNCMKHQGHFMCYCDLSESENGFCYRTMKRTVTPLWSPEIPAPGSPGWSPALSTSSKSEPGRRRAADASARMWRSRRAKQVRTCLCVSGRNPKNIVSQKCGRKPAAHPEPRDPLAAECCSTPLERVP